MKYLKKPVMVEAIKYTGDNVEEIKEFTEGKMYQGAFDTLNILTLEGVMRAKVGDYIVKGIEGEYYPVNERIFNKTYELMED